MVRLLFTCLLFSLFVVGLTQAQRFQPNYDEKKVPQYTLPDPLTLANGQKVTDAKTWRTKRRPEILELFRKHVYGRSPMRPKNVKYDVTVDKNALGGKAIRKQVTIYLTGKGNGPKIHILIYLPAKVKKPVPVFLTLNFYGNHSIGNDPGILLSKSWMRNNKDYGVINHKATEKSRGVRSSRWAIEEILARGYGLATIYYGDIDPDFDDGFKNGVHSVFKQNGPEAWGSIATWAWGLSCAMDYLEQDDDVDHTKVIVMGHSRLGKTSLWAGAADERFAIVISNNSGCGGAALSRRRFGETVGRINKSFPHWFCDNFNKYNNNEDELPVDQHMLLALIAPRPVYVASAVEDRWADPRGEFLSAYHASPVYRLLGKKGLPAQKMPSVDRPVMGTIGYHVRSGGHDVKLYDWQRYMDFADMHFGKKK
ncbi:MAG: acetylxylan esterase [Gemmataceae bacterium]